MLFNSIDFLLFFPIVICIYFLMPYRFRWILLLIASYYFYMCWKVEYILLIMISTIVDYYVALKMEEKTEKADRKKFLYISLFVNLGILFSFKYFNFFADNVQQFFDNFNIFYDVPHFKALLPVGISFYTFQTLSYSIDVYNGKVKAEKHLGLFALYVSYFPQLVAGPIERPGRLLPQFRQNFDFDYDRVVAGLKMMAWGFFMKLVIADNAAMIVNEVYNHPNQYQGLATILGTYCFAFQIFCDFAGYSIIAIGAAKVMGHDLMQNFRRPYLATSIRDFWQRWHISLSTWFRDYVYIPLGGNRVVKWRWYYNLFITFLVSGLWHGAAWTFVIWGALHGIYLIVGIISQPIRTSISEKTGLAAHPNLHKAWQVLITFLLACFAWIFFRANNLKQALIIIKNTFYIDGDQFSLSLIPNQEWTLAVLGIFIPFLLAVHLAEEYLGWNNPLFAKNKFVRWGFYLFIVGATLSFGKFGSNEFIYFRF